MVGKANIRSHNDKIILPNELKLKNIKNIVCIPNVSKCQLKWDAFWEQLLIVAMVISATLNNISAMS
jgi:hypothetical protein